MKKHALPILYFLAFLIAIVACSLPSCSATTGGGGPGSGGSSSTDCKDPANAHSIKCLPSDFIDCAKVDIGQIVDFNNMMSLLGQVAQIIANGGQGWQAALEQLGVKFGIDAVACAVKAVETVMGVSMQLPPELAGSAGPKATGAMSSPAAQRAALFLKAKGYKFKEPTPAPPPPPGSGAGAGSGSGSAK